MYRLTYLICLFPAVFIAYWALGGALYLSKHAKVEATLEQSSVLEVEDETPEQAPSLGQPEYSYGELGCTFVGVLPESSPVRCVLDGTRENFLNSVLVPDSFYNDHENSFPFKDNLVAGANLCKAALAGPAALLRDSSITQVDFDGQNVAVKKWVCVNETGEQG